ncbi:hypothetical protein [Duganella sp. LjRoot269]|uniref:hypothetical protein n=1 Tax=Duganella sp. LjRoot269 TaxID=3342305 RepID=UPI003ECF5967
MITSTTEFDLHAASQSEPRLGAARDGLRQYPSAFLMTQGAYLPSLIPKEYHHLPMIVISSRRITDHWLRTISGAELTLDGCCAGFHSRPYLAWPGKGGTVAISTYDVDDAIGESSGVRQVLVLWLAETQALLGWVDTDKQFQDLLYVASRSRYLSRFVPDSDYVNAKKALFPVLLSADEEVLIGSEGEPVYVARKVEFAG